MRWSSQQLTNKPFWWGIHPGFLQFCARTYTHIRAITDVTRIQEGVAAYYILPAHTGCLAWLGLFKRLRLDKQRGLCLCSLLISSHLFLCLCIHVCCSVLIQSYNLPYSPCKHTQKGPKLSLSEY